MNRRFALLVLVGLAVGLSMGAFHLGVLGFHPDALATSSARRARAVTRAPAVLGALTGRTPTRAVRVTVEPLRYDAEVWRVEVGGGPPLSLLALHGGETVALGPVLEARGGGYRLLGSREPGRPAAAPRTPDRSKVRLDPRDLAPGSGSGPWLAVYTAPRCPACARLTMAPFMAARATGARIYLKPLVAPRDRAALRMTAVTIALEGKVPARTWWRIHRLLAMLLAAGADEDDLLGVLRLLADNTRDPSLRAAFLTGPGPETTRRAARLRREARRVGVAATPTYLTARGAVRPGPLHRTVARLVEALNPHTAKEGRP